MGAGVTSTQIFALSRILGERSYAKRDTQIYSPSVPACIVPKVGRARNAENLAEDIVVKLKKLQELRDQGKI